MKPQSMNPKLWAIIPAAGSGKRFSETDLKQYQTIAGQTVLEHTVNALAGLALQRCVIAISESDQTAKSLNLPANVEFCIGGQERMDSVLAALDHLSNQVQDDDYVLVQDAARPCLHPLQIKQILEFCATNQDAAILAVPVRDTLKKSTTDQAIAHTVNREQLWQAQTPQIVKFAILRHALRQAIDDGAIVTDEASALERLGISVKLLSGRSDNIKITYPEDIHLAKLIIESKSTTPFFTTK